jgi:hypothetical protein
VDGPADRVAAYATRHRTELLVFGILVALGATLLIALLVGLSNRLRTADESVSALATLGLAGGVMTQTLVIEGAVFAQAESFIQAEAITVDAVSALFAARRNVLFYLFFAISAWPTVLAASAYGAAILKTGVPGRVAAWLAFVAAVIRIVAVVALTPSGVMAPSGPIGQTAPAIFMLWVIVVCVGLLVRRPDRVAELGRAHSSAATGSSRT